MPTVPLASSPLGTPSDDPTSKPTSVQRLSDLFSLPTSDPAGPTEPLILPTNLLNPTPDELMEATHDRKSFSEQVPGRQVVIDSTSLKKFQECPRKYYYEIVLGLKTTHMAVDLAFGIAYQAALELYDHLRADAKSHKEAVIQALRTGLALGRNLPRSVDDSDEGKETKRYDMLATAIVWHAEQFHHDPLETVILANGKAAVELSFRFDSGYTMGDEAVALSGHFDRVVRTDSSGAVYILDHKSTKTAPGSHYQRQFRPDTQIMLYTIAAGIVFDKEAAGVIIDAAHLSRHTVEFSRFTVPVSNGERKEFFSELGYWFGSIDACAIQRHWPANPESCFLCPFNKICAQEPQTRKLTASTEFIMDKWDPAQPRQERKPITAGWNPGLPAFTNQAAD